MGCSIEPGETHDDLVDCLRSLSKRVKIQSGAMASAHLNPFLYALMTRQSVPKSPEWPTSSWTIMVCGWKKKHNQIIAQVSPGFKHQHCLHRVQQGGPGKWGSVVIMMALLPFDKETKFYSFLHNMFRSAKPGHMRNLTQQKKWKWILSQY